MSYLLNIPHDVEKIIYRNVHEMNIKEVMSQLQKEMFQMNDIFLYLQKRAFYPYIFRFKIFKRYFLKETSLYCTNKLYRYIHYKLFSRCLPSIIKNQHIIFDDSE